VIRRLLKRGHIIGEINCLPKTQLLANTLSGSIRSDSCPMIVS
jgi:hypothetical protein